MSPRCPGFKGSTEHAYSRLQVLLLSHEALPGPPLRYGKINYSESPFSFCSIFVNIFNPFRISMLSLISNNAILLVDVTKVEMGKVAEN